MKSLKISPFLLILLLNFCLGYENEFSHLNPITDRIAVDLKANYYSYSQHSLVYISAFFSKPVMINTEKIRVFNGKVENLQQESSQRLIIIVKIINEYEFSKLVILDGFGVAYDRNYSQRNSVLIKPLKIDESMLSTRLSVTMEIDNTSSTKQLPYVVKLSFNPPLLENFNAKDLSLNNIIVVTTVCNYYKTQCKLYVIPYESNSNINTITLNANSLVSIYNTTNSEAITTKVAFNKNNINKYIIYQKMNGKFDMFADIWENRKNNKIFKAIFEVPCLDTKYFGLLQDSIHSTNYYYVKVTPSGLYLNKYVNGKDKSLKSMGLRCQIDRVPFWVTIDRSDGRLVKISFGNSNVIGQSRLLYYEDSDYASIDNIKYLTFANTNITTIISSIKVNCPFNDDKECNGKGKCSNSLKCECSLFYTGNACQSIDVIEVVLPIVSILVIVGSAIGLYVTKNKWLHLIKGENDEERETETGNELSLIENEC